MYSTFENSVIRVVFENADFLNWLYQLTNFWAHHSNMAKSFFVTTELR